MTGETIQSAVFSRVIRFLWGIHNTRIRIFNAGSCKTVIHIVIQKSGQNTKKPQQKQFYCGFVVVPPGIEPGTQGFSVLCSTN